MSHIKTVSFLFFGWGLSVSAFAISPGRSLQRHALAAAPSPKSTPPVPTRLNCTNFSGTWSGSCVQDGQAPTSDSTIIAQSDCTTIIDDGDELTVPGVNTSAKSNASDGQTQSVQIGYDWDNSRTTLLFRGVALVKDSSSTTVTDQNGSIRLQDSKLIVDTKVRATGTSSGGPVDISFESVCTYSNTAAP